MKNYYYTLGISSDATPEEIKQAYLKLVIKFHPDNNNNDLFFAEHFKKIDEAFEVLFDKEKRKHYDLLINNEQISQIESSFSEKLGNGITLDMIFVEGGIFMMGSNNGEDDEIPIHSVTLDSFYIGKFQVTQAQWKAIMGNNPSHFKGDDLPVEKVSWNDAQVFLQKLNEKFPFWG